MVDANPRPDTGKHADWLLPFVLPAVLMWLPYYLTGDATFTDWNNKELVIFAVGVSAALMCWLYGADINNSLWLFRFITWGVTVIAFGALAVAGLRRCYIDCRLELKGGINLYFPAIIVDLIPCLAFVACLMGFLRTWKTRPRAGAVETTTETGDTEDGEAKG